MQIPILRLGESYESADLVELNENLTTHTANPGLIRRDLLRISESKVTQRSRQDPEPNHRKVIRHS